MTQREAAAFAASCAERLVPLFRLERESEGEAEVTVGEALESAWRAARGSVEHVAEMVTRLRQLAGSAALPRSRPSFVADAPACLVYALTAASGSDPAACAVAAGTRAHEVVDAIVLWRDGVDLATPGIEERLRRDPLIRTELDKQARDRNALASGDTAAVTDELRAESARLGERYAAEVRATLARR
jgi:hypothetical protein